MEFTATWGTPSKIMTAFMALINIIFLIVLFTAYKDEPQFFLFPVVLLFITFVITYLFQPLKYIVESDRIEIVRRFNKFKIAKSDILSVEKLSNDDMGMAWRTFGNGGLFGYTGWFTSRSQGKMRWFVTQRNNYVRITLQNHKVIILSPDDVNGFTQATQW